MNCLNCKKHLVIVTSDHLCSDCRVNPKIIQEVDESTRAEAQELLMEIIKLCSGKNPNISLNALGVAVGVLIGPFNNPEQREDVWRSFKQLASANIRLYTTLNIRAQAQARQLALDAEKQKENPPSNLD